MVRIIEPLQQLHAGALPAAAAAHKCQRLARLHRHIQPVQDLDVWSGGVGELAVNELNVALEAILKTEEGGTSTKVRVGLCVRVPLPVHKRQVRLDSFISFPFLVHVLKKLSCLNE